MEYQVSEIQPHILIPAHDKCSTEAELAAPNTIM